MARAGHRRAVQRGPHRGAGLTDDDQRNRQGPRVSSLAQTDPEFIAYFDDFAFGDSVELRTRLLVQLAAVLAAGGSAEFHVLATAALADAPQGCKHFHVTVVRSVVRGGVGL